MRGNRVVTPPPYVGILRGITRGVVLRIAAEAGHDVREDVFTRHELYTADEVFLTGTAAEIVPVVKIDNRRIGAGKPGPVTVKLMKAFQKVTLKEGLRYKI